jgi:hypothetical protein
MVGDRELEVVFTIAPVYNSLGSPASSWDPQRFVVHHPRTYTTGTLLVLFTLSCPLVGSPFLQRHRNILSSYARRRTTGTRRYYCLWTYKHTSGTMIETWKRLVSVIRTCTVTIIAKRTTILNMTELRETEHAQWHENIYRRLCSHQFASLCSKTGHVTASVSKESTM